MTETAAPDVKSKRFRWVDRGYLAMIVLPILVLIVLKVLFTPLSEVAKEYELPISVHISETIKENDDCMKSYGCTPVQKLDSYGLLTDTTVAAHCVHLTDEDRKILAERNAGNTVECRFLCDIT